MDNRELIKALNELETDKGIDKELVFEAIEDSLTTACKKNYGTDENIKVDINRETGDIKVFALKRVEEDVYDAFLEVSLEDAREIDVNYDYGDMVPFEITPKDFGRISAQTAKQVVVQKLREAEKDRLFNEYIKKEKEIDTAIIQRVDKKGVIVTLGKMEAMLLTQDQIPGEKYIPNERIKVYVSEVKKPAKGTGLHINVSRTRPELVKRLLELEVPEVMDGTVEIKSIAREAVAKSPKPGMSQDSVAGPRTKVAVYSKNPNVEPVGACVGNNGARINVIVDELNGEKIDVILWDEDPKKFIAAALNPAKVISVEILSDGEEKKALVVVPDTQLSLAIGKEGQNVRLAARLTGWKIDIKSESQAELQKTMLEADTDADLDDIFIDDIDLDIDTDTVSDDTTVE
jgi:N utilization substance protein A